MPQNDLHRRAFLAIAGAALAAPSLAGARRSARDALDAPRRLALDAVRSRAVPSLAIAVLRNGRPLWVESFGWADRERRVRATAGTRYAIASATKPFTATAIAMLCESGRIGLHDPILDYLQGLDIAPDPAFARVTVAEVLQHRSGIPRHWRNHFQGQGAPPPFEEVARAHAFTTAAHRNRYLYSNLNYGLLARAIEQVTGRNYHDHLARTLLGPLGLASATSLGALADAWSAARPYEEDGSPIPPYLVDEQGARDLAMTASDLARFGLAHLSGGRAFDPGAGRLMLSERSPIPEEGAARVYYGLGWMIDEDSPAALFSFGHTGEGPGAASSLTIVPRERLVVATIANAQGPPAYRINEAIVDTLSPEFASRRRAHPFRQSKPEPGAIAGFGGDWSGRIETPEGPIPARLSIAGAGSASFALADGAAGGLTQLSVDRGVLSARSTARLPGAEARLWPHSLRLHLERTDAGLDGTVAAYASRGPIAHDQFWLSYKARLRPLQAAG